MGRNKKIHDLYDVTLHIRLSKSQYNFLVDYISKLDSSLSVSSFFRKYIDKLMSLSK